MYRMLLIPALVLLGSVLLGALILWAHVDDWSRDLFVNHAATAADHRDAGLRPLERDGSTEDAARHVRNVAAKLPRWEFVDESSRGSNHELHFVRTTRWLRFRDDVWVRIADEQGTAVISAESKSRVGKGDLGQNPRNIKELFAALCDAG